MFGRGRGGLEQAALDYAEALRLAGLETLSVTDPEAWANAPLAAQSLPATHLRVRGAWDIPAALRLRRIARKSGARAAICHGNRALSLALRALSGRIPVIAVAHNYQTRRFPRASACIAVTEHGAQALVTRGVAAARIHVVPNAVRMPEPPDDADAAEPRAFRNPPVIGAMGRFVVKKGFDHFITALGLLERRGLRFRAILAGDGPERDDLEAQAAHAGVRGRVTFSGWVEDRDAFFRDIDVFALPSLHEPFGIVLLEAMAHSLPIAAADAEGPSEILRPHIDGLLVARDDAPALADALEQLLRDEEDARRMADNARQRVEETYGLGVLAARLRAVLESVITRNSA